MVRSPQSTWKESTVGKTCERGRKKLMRLMAGSERVRELWMVSVGINRGKWCGRGRKRQVRDGQTGMKLTERSMDLIPETRWRKSYKERSVIRDEEDVGGRARVTTDEERLLPSWTEMRSCRYGGWVVVQDFASLYSMRSVTWSQWRERKIGVIRQDLAALTTARATEFWICWRRVIMRLMAGTYYIGTWVSFWTPVLQVGK